MTVREPFKRVSNVFEQYKVNLCSFGEMQSSVGTLGLGGVVLAKSLKQ